MLSETIKGVFVTDLELWSAGSAEVPQVWNFERSSLAFRAEITMFDRTLLTCCELQWLNPCLYVCILYQRILQGVFAKPTLWEWSVEVIHMLTCAGNSVNISSVQFVCIKQSSLMCWLVFWRCPCFWADVIAQPQIPVECRSVSLIEDCELHLTRANLFFFLAVLSIFWYFNCFSWFNNLTNVSISHCHR